MAKPHKHAALIKAWADGAEIQYQYENTTMWVDLGDSPAAWHPTVQYRIKPEPKPDVVKFCSVSPDHSGRLTSGRNFLDNVKYTFCGETGKLLKVELIQV